MKTSTKRRAPLAAASVAAFCLMLGAAQGADPPSNAPSEDVVISFPEVPEGKDAAFYQDLRKQVADAADVAGDGACQPIRRHHNAQKTVWAEALPR